MPGYFPQSQPFIWDRRTWGAMEPTTNLPPLGPVTRVTVHHTVSTRKDPLVEIKDIQLYHITKEPEPFSDIGYHYVIDRAENIDGRDIYQGRKPQSDGGLSLGAHVAGHNTGNIGVAVLGNYDQEDLSPGQQQVLEELLAWLSYKYDIPIHQIKGHRDLNVTDCPGDHIYDRLPALRENLVRRLYGIQVNPAYAPLPNGEVRIVINNKELKPSVPAFIKDGKTVAPLRDVAEALGQVVYFDDRSWTVYVQSPKG
ncbi:MAG: N-acetylmuramoyl-L-alanine amidase [Firmicutes bacterium]|nr:N-acetylmuramoyl-L-alanine amidase [Bacillota bacterium]MCL5039305.1 N-acetylmuramoyl-L-alanine amidase [Bacillota bacterium]